jgi:hypothetical protein
MTAFLARQEFRQRTEVEAPRFRDGYYADERLCSPALVKPLDAAAKELALREGLASISFYQRKIVL